MRVHFVIHEAFEAPGAYYDWAIKRGHEVSLTKLYQGEKLPVDSSKIDLLIVMGGPQSPRTTVEECPHFDAQAEIALIKDAIAHDKRIIGVCLGAQLLGEAYGAPVEHSPEKEIGNFPLVKVAHDKSSSIVTSITLFNVIWNFQKTWFRIYWLKKLIMMNKLPHTLISRQNKKF